VLAAVAEESPSIFRELMLEVPTFHSVHRSVYVLPFVSFTKEGSLGTVRTRNFLPSVENVQSGAKTLHLVFVHQ
jgi:hypothetical protein